MNINIASIIGIIIIGIALMLIVGAFVFSNTFRKDVIASEGEASMFGVLNIKGVIIILLMGVLVTALVLIINNMKPENFRSSGTSRTAVTPGSPGSSGTPKTPCPEKECPPQTAIIKHHTPNGRTKVKTAYQIDDSNLYFKVDTIEYFKGSYEFSVYFGEKDIATDTIVWKEEPLPFTKVPDAAIKDYNFKSISYKNSYKKWTKSYKILVALGQPLEDLKNIDKVQILLLYVE